MTERPSGPDGRSGHVTRNDVARVAGVSPAVVSYVVNGGPKSVAPQTRDKVLAAIATLGYRPNSLARALRMGSSKTIGLLIPDIGNPLFAEIAREIAAAASAEDLALILATSGGGARAEKRQLQNLVSRRVDGAVVVTPTSEDDLGELADAPIPVVVVNGRDEQHRLRSVGVDLLHGTRLGVEHLIEHGHTSIALVMGNNGLRGSLERERGWLESLEAAGLRQGPVIPVAFSREGGYAAGRRLLQSDSSASAVFVSSDLQAIGVLRALHEAGVRVPDEMAVVSLDGTVESEYTWPPLTVVRQPLRVLAGDAVAALLGTGPDGPVHTSRHGDLILRSSCGPHPPG